MATCISLVKEGGIAVDMPRSFRTDDAATVGAGG
jgi:hypothetical protein